MIDQIIKVLLSLKWRKHPEWLGTSYAIDDLTDIHVLVETWRDGKHWFGTKEDGDENG